MIQHKVTLLDIKQAMRDHRFRDSLPPELHEEIDKFLSNPSCKCNMPLYVKIIKNCKEQIQNYFPGKIITDIEEESKQVNTWTVINCNINELEANLKKLPIGQKSIAIARYGDQVTVVVNELELEK